MGKYVKGQSGNPAGRPKGCLTARTRAILDIENKLLERRDDIMAMIDEMICAGDTSIIKLLLDKVMPAPKGRFIDIKFHEGASLSEKCESILKGIENQLITIDEAEKLQSIVKQQAELIELEAIQERLDKLEKNR